MVELDPSDENDVDVINEIKYYWGGKKSLSYALATNMNNIYNGITDKGLTRFFALTEQKKKFENLNPKKLLSVAEITTFNKEITSIDLLETYFKESHLSKKARFKHIGTAMLESIIFLFRGTNIILESAYSAEDFYLKHGFVKVKGGINRLFFRSYRF